MVQVAHGRKRTNSRAVERLPRLLVSFGLQTREEDALVRILTFVPALEALEQGTRERKRLFVYLPSFSASYPTRTMNLCGTPRSRPARGKWGPFL